MKMYAIFPLRVFCCCCLLSSSLYLTEDDRARAGRQEGDRQLHRQLRIRHENEPFVRRKRVENSENQLTTTTSSSIACLQ